MMKLNLIIILGIFNVLAIKSKPSNFKDTCGKSKIADESPSKMVMEGRPVTPHSYPWHASIKKTIEGNKLECGGSLISTKHVLSAAHCIKYPEGYSQHYTVILGAHDLHDSKEKGRLEIHVTEKNVIWHPMFTRSGTKGFDIGLITFDKPVKFSRYIQPICLPEPESRVAETKVTQLSWSPGKNTTNKLKKWVTNVSSMDKREQLARESLKGLNKTDLKALSKPVAQKSKKQKPVHDIIKAIEHMSIGKYFMIHEGMNPCTGFPGGGLIHKDGKDQYVLIGIASYAIGVCRYKKGFPEPIYYTKVTEYLDWIKEETEDD